MIKYFYMGEPTTRKFLESKFGVTNIEKRIKHARDKWGYDPYTDVTWADGVSFINKAIF